MIQLMVIGLIGKWQTIQSALKKPEAEIGRNQNGVTVQIRNQCMVEIFAHFLVKIPPLQILSY